MAKSKSDETTQLLNLVVEAILDIKGNDIVSLDLTELKDAVAKYFVIAHGDSGVQVNAIQQHIMDESKKAGYRPYHSEGQKNNEWVIVDFVDVVVHIFYREKRDFYQLEELWSDAKITKHNPTPTIKKESKRPKTTLPKKAATKSVKKKSVKK